MAVSTIKPAIYSDGTYKRKSPQIVFTYILQLSRDELKACTEGKRGYSCRGDKLHDVARYCVNIAREHNAKSWSIYPIPGEGAVYIEFHSWPQMGMCNFDEPVVRRKNYWWDERPIPEWMAPNDPRAEKDPDGHFDLDA